MCGIVGKISLDKQEINSETIKLMMQQMKHRGPNDNGTFIQDHIGFGFVRLSIIDLSPDGHQPFVSENGNFTMIFNGEIFNYIELREELIALGYKFRTKTDTEVLLNAYIAWGEEGLHKLNGMWSFAVYNQQTNKIFICRDRYGIKPLYYYNENNNFYFASEIPSILSVCEQHIDANSGAIFNYLIYDRIDYSKETFFKNIFSLPHGHCIIIDFNNVSQPIEIKKWYDINEKVKLANGFGDYKDFRQTFIDAVKLRMRSDVPVGVCLSGGLDSSAITSVIMDELKVNNLNTFSAVYGKDSWADESNFIDLYNNKPGQRHFISPSSETLLKDIDSFIVCQAEPVPSTSPYAQYKVMELAKENIVVTLDGQGADELLGGYHYFFGFYYKDLLKKFKLITLFKEIFYYLKIHKSLFAIKTFVFFLLPKKARTSIKVAFMDYFNQKFIDENINSNNVISDTLFSSESLQAALINHFEYKLEHLLKWEDRNSMFFSLEARVPFLDHILVERTLATKSDLIIRNGMTKYLLRESLKDILPEPIKNRVDKKGFSTPQDEWFRTKEWQKIIQDIINSESFKNRNFYNVQKVKEKYQKHLNKEVNISKEIWKWIHLELWYRKYIDNQQK